MWQKILAISVLCFFCLSSTVQILAQPIDGYTYLYIPTEGNPEIAILVISNESISQETTIQLPSSMGKLSDALLSPHGDWIALFYTPNPTGGGLRLFNTLTSEVRDLVAGRFALNSSMRSRQSQVVAWSLDGHYLAFDILTDNGITLYLYALQENKLTPIAENLLHYSRMVWSPDSSLFAFERSNCTDDGKCTFSIELLDPVSLSIDRSIDVSSLFLGNSVVASTVCSMAWSPDGRYLSLVSVCDLTALEARKEVFYLDLESGNLIQLTHYTDEARKTEGAISLIGQYSTFWLDDTILLIGAIVGSNRELLTETVEFTIPNTNSIKIIDAAATEWANDPQTKSLFFRTTANVSVDTFLPTSVGMVKLDSANKAISLGSSEVRAIACNLSVSPDGAYVAYSEHVSKRCEDGIATLTFVNLASSNIIEFDFSVKLKSDVDRIIPLGWVQIGAAGQ
ncbi:MAG: hypothetical protein KF726_18165 [Anaerolineae bacterium]|nr:hypothetical protein [Anaerolineae bacterium]